MSNLLAVHRFVSSFLRQSKRPVILVIPALRRPLLKRSTRPYPDDVGIQQVRAVGMTKQTNKSQTSLRVWKWDGRK